MNNRQTKLFWKRILFTFTLLIPLWLAPGVASALSDAQCFGCHGQDFDEAAFKETVHGPMGCTLCHSEAGEASGMHPVPLAAVDCGDCHGEIAEVNAQSAHGKAYTAGDEMAARCADCHTTHDIFSPDDPRSSTYPLNIPATCGQCHEDDTEMTNTHKLRKEHVVEDYAMSIHGRGLYRDGLIVTATCSSCHNNHDVQPAAEPDSSIHRDNIVATCTECHVGIGQRFRESVHSPQVTETDKTLPVCTDCHSDHTITRVDKDDFRQVIAEQCGNCHGHYSSTYLETYHGRASMLGGSETLAKCSDCHGAHDIMPSTSASSRIHPDNIVETCKECHPKANASFATYYTHATHSNKEEYPRLYYSFWIMTGLLIATFTFFGIHTLLWLPRSFLERRRLKREHHQNQK